MDISDVQINSQAQSHKLNCHILEVGHKILLLLLLTVIYIGGWRPQLWRLGNSCRIHSIFHCTAAPLEAAVSSANAPDRL